MNCPRCKTGILTISTWSYPATRDEPGDAGFEIDKQTCKCGRKDPEKFDEEVMNVMLAYEKEMDKEMKLEHEIKQMSRIDPMQNPETEYNKATALYEVEFSDKEHSKLLDMSAYHDLYPKNMVNKLITTGFDNEWDAVAFKKSREQNPQLSDPVANIVEDYLYKYNWGYINRFRNKLTDGRGQYKWWALFNRVEDSAGKLLSIDFVNSKSDVNTQNKLTNLVNQIQKLVGPKYSVSYTIKPTERKIVASLYVTNLIRGCSREQNPRGLNYEHSKAWETASPPDYTHYPEEEDPDYVDKTKGIVRSGSHLLVEQNPIPIRVKKFVSGHESELRSLTNEQLYEKYGAIGSDWIIYLLGKTNNNMEQNPLLSPQAAEEFARRQTQRQPQLPVQYTGRQEPRTVYWIAGRDTPLQQLRIQILQQELENIYHKKIIVVERHTSSIKGGGRVPSGWEFQVVG